MSDKQRTELSNKRSWIIKQAKIFFFSRNKYPNKNPKEYAESMTNLSQDTEVWNKFSN